VSAKLANYARFFSRSLRSRGGANYAPQKRLALP